MLNFQDALYGIIGEKQRHVFGFLFDEVDKDKNGSVTLEELKLKMQPAVSKHEIKHFVQVYFFKSQLSLLQDLLKTLACAEVTRSPSLFPVVLTRYCHGCSGTYFFGEIPTSRLSQMRYPLFWWLVV